MKWSYLVWILPLILFLAACEGKSTPEKAVEDYLKAWVKGDEKALREVVCAEQENEIPRLAVMFNAVEAAELKDVSCKSADANTVTCAGAVALRFDPNNYSAAQFGIVGNEMPLDTYHVTQEDGRWKWCGEVLD